MSRFVENVKRSSGIVPTLFDIGEIWRLNRPRCGGRFNLMFFWMYPIASTFLAPYTLFCMIHVAFKPGDQSG